MEYFVIGAVLFIAVFIIAVGFLFALANFYRKVGPEEAIVRSGAGGLKATTGSGIWVIPVMHRSEHMDLSVKRIEIHRGGEAGLICRDNIRADIEVAFFVRVNNTRDDILNVAQSLGCRRASEQQALVELFDAKFSEALKTVGKRFDFVELYNERDKFKDEILKVLGTELNGYVLDDCAIDYLEQTPIEKLNPQNILDAEGIKKITDLTSREHIIANHIRREKEKTITKQDVEAREAILELERQKVEAEEKQRREISEITSREQAQAAKVREEERLKAERARITSDEEIQVAEENKDRQIIVARKSKERTEAVETERVTKDRDLEVTERERVVSLAQIEKDKAIEVEKRNIQEVIRERVIVERAVVEQEEKIKDTREFAAADRMKQVSITAAEMTAQEALVKEVRAADAKKQSAERYAEQIVIEAEASRASAEKETQAKKMLAEAKTAEAAAIGLADAQVMEAQAVAIEKHGTAEATVLERKATAEAKGLEAKATAEARGLEAKAVAAEKQGTAEAKVMHLKYSSEASGIEEKANAMKLFDGVGKEHEEFKLRLNKDKDIEIAAIQAQQGIAEAQSHIVGEALKSAKIDIVGGETTFFDRIVGAVKGGKVVDRFVYNSDVLTDVKNSFFNGDPNYFREKLESMISHFNLDSHDVRDLSIAALIGKMLLLSGTEETRSELQRLLQMVKSLGMSDERVSALNLNPTQVASTAPRGKSK